MTNDMLNGYVFMNEELLLNLYPRPFSGDIIEEVLPGNTLYVCYDLEEAESILEDCKDRLSKEFFDIEREPDDLHLSILGTIPISVRYLMDRDIITKKEVILEPFYKMEED